LGVKNNIPPYCLPLFNTCAKFLKDETKFLCSGRASNATTYTSVAVAAAFSNNNDSVSTTTSLGGSDDSANEEDQNNNKSYRNGILFLFCYSILKASTRQQMQSILSGHHKRQLI